MNSATIREQIRASLVKQEEPSSLPVEQQREEWEQSASQMPLPLGVSAQRLIANGVPGLLLVPHERHRADLILHIHGGGFILGSSTTHRDLGARLALAARAEVLLVDYRRAPEHPFPAARDDALTAYLWALENGYEANSITVSADSAGGHIALTALLEAREQQRPLPRGFVLISPWLDLSQSGVSMRDRLDAEPLISRADLADCAKKYLADIDAHAAAVAPLEGDLRRLPDILIHVGDDEILLSDSQRLAERARAAGARVRLKIWPKLWHVFHAWAPDLPQANEAIEEIGAFVRR